MGMNDMLRKMAVLLERRQDALFSVNKKNTLLN